MLKSSTRTIRVSLTLTRWKKTRIKSSRKRLRRKFKSQKVRSTCFRPVVETTLATSHLTLDLNSQMPFQEYSLMQVEEDSVWCKAIRDSKVNQRDNRDLWAVDSNLRCRKWIVVSNRIQCNSNSQIWCSIRTQWVACNRCPTSKWDSIQAWWEVWISNSSSQCSQDSSHSSTCSNSQVWCPKWTNSRIKDRATLVLCKDDWHN